MSETEDFLAFTWEDYVTVWEAYIDESGTDDEPKFVGVGNVVAPHDVWEQLLDDWLAVLREFGLDYYHAAKFNSRKGHFDKLTIADQNGCSIRLIDLFRGRNIGAFVDVIRKSEFRLVEDSLPSPTFEPYDLLLERSVSNTLAFASLVPGENSFRILIEAGPKMRSKLVKYLIAGCGSGKLAPIHHIGTMPKSKCPAFQVADMIAYEGFKSCLQITDRPHKGERKSFTALKENMKIKLTLHHSIDSKLWFNTIREIME